MKKQLITTAVAVLLAASTYPQGTMQFNNFSPLVNAPIRAFGALITDTTGR